MTAKEKLIQIVERAKNNNLEYAERAFRGFTEDQLNENYGLSGISAREILKRYREERRDWEQAYELAKSIDEYREDIVKHLISRIPNDYRKSGAGIGGDMNRCEYCNRTYDSCRCNEVYNKALSDIRKILNEEFK